MRSKFTIASLFIVLQLSAVLLSPPAAYSQDRPDGNQLIASTLSKRDAGTQILPHNITPNWYSQAVAKLEEREYFIRTLDKPGMFAAVNHAQHLGYLFTGKGYTVSNFNEDGSTKGLWNTHFLFAGIGRKGQLHEQSLSNTTQTGDQTLRYDYRDYSIRYDNWQRGMEQSFIIHKRPSGKSELQVAIRLTGDLEARVGDNNQLLLYTAGNPKDVKLVYDQLTVVDQNKKSLPAHLLIADPHKLLLVVDDSHATYPITVDPLNHLPGQIFQGNNVLGSSLVDATIHMLYGFSLSGAGDVNGDGIDDVIIGSPLFTQVTAITAGVLSASVTVTGAAFIYYGVAVSGPTSTPSKVLQPTGLAANSLFGYSVSTAGKFDGAVPTRSGVVVGAPVDQTTLSVGILPVPTLVATGRVYVYSGSAFTGDVNTIPAPSAILAPVTADFGPFLFSPPANPFYGFSVSNAGNINGDAFDDIVVGSPYFTSLGVGPALAGRVDIYHGSLTGIVTTPAVKILGQTASELFGFSVSSTGKVNGATPAFDGIIGGAPGFLAAGGQLQGHAYLFYGKTGGVTATSVTTADLTLAPGSASIASLYGFSVSTAGDVNADGIDDVIVGEPLALDLTGAAGKAYIYYGSATGIVATGGTTLVSPRSPTIVGGLAQNLLFGYSVGKAGNVTGDAGGEVLVGEPGSAALSNPVIGTLLGLLSGQPNLSGQAYIFRGVAGSHIANNAAPFVTYNDPGVLSAANLLGSSVHYAGDVNNDGFPDFLVGSPNGTLDLGLNLSLLSNVTGGAFGTGLIVNSNTSNSYLFFGFTGPLPVTWLSFTGTAEKTDALLTWSTAQEQNSSYYGVERSSDNSTFVAIGTVGAAHNSNSVTNYSFTDASPVNGTNYYRLKQADLDGRFVYSKVVAVNFNGTEANVIAVYPNPAHESFQLRFRNMKAGQYEMNLISPVGQIIQSRSIQVDNPASYAETVNLTSGLAQGTYMVRIVDQQQHVFISKVVIR